MRVIIGIQARSTSTRFPNKVFELLDGKELLQHILDAAESSCLYINKFFEKNHITVNTVLLVPMGDPIIEKYRYKSIVFEGDENDVLKRYYDMNKQFNADYVVRLTSDCPLLPAYMISKHINIAIKNKYDYVSNVDKDSRTSVDGHDVEVISKRCLQWLNDNAIDTKHREHVTLRIREPEIPEDFRIAHVIGHLYQPDIKLSVDTKEDLENVKKEYFRIKSCIRTAIKKSGVRSVYRV